MRGSVLILVFGVSLSGLAAEHASPRFKIDPSPPPRDAQPGLSFAPVAEKVGPSVVNVYSTRAAREPMSEMPFMQDPLFRRFFGGRSPFEMPQPQRPQQGLGSGVIVSENGYIITNNHVVEDSSEIRVVLPSGQEYAAKVIGTDPATDIAVVKVDATNLPAITIADSTQLKVGDGVLAVGNPFGVGQTVTMGIVSATGRAGFGIVDYEDFIQTDASINPGNSGGALTDVTGRLMGINTAIISRTGGSQGIGFAVPSNMARHITEQIIEKGRVERGYLGVTIQPLTRGLAEAFNAKGTQGALVAGVSSDSPAARAGLKEGDVITEFDGKKVTDSRHLRLMVAQTAPDTRAMVKVLREGKEQTATVRLGELPATELAMGAQGRPGERGSRRGGFLHGLELSELTDRARQQFGLPDNVDGVLVLAVQPGSPAERAGIEPGDVLTEVNRKKVESVEDAFAAARRGDDESTSVLLKVWSGGAARYVALEPATRERREDR